MSRPTMLCTACWLWFTLWMPRQVGGEPVSETAGLNAAEEVQGPSEDLGEEAPSEADNESDRAESAGSPGAENSISHPVKLTASFGAGYSPSRYFRSRVSTSVAIGLRRARFEGGLRFLYRPEPPYLEDDSNLTGYLRYWFYREFWLRAEAGKELQNRPELVLGVAAGYRLLSWLDLGLSLVNHKEGLAEDEPDQRMTEAMLFFDIGSAATVYDGKRGAATGGRGGAFYARLGYASAPSLSGRAEQRHGPTLGFGYRRWLGPWLLDASIMNLHEWSYSEGDETYDARSYHSILRAGGSRQLPIAAPGRLYAGAGLGYGESSILYPWGDGFRERYNSYGLQAQGTLGWQFANYSWGHLFVEGAVTLPLHRVEDVPGGVGAEGIWAPLIDLSSGIAVGR